jgi:hypothetical protein
MLPLHGVENHVRSNISQDSPGTSRRPSFHCPFEGLDRTTIDLSDEVYSLLGCSRGSSSLRCVRGLSAAWLARRCRAANRAINVTVCPVIGIKSYGEHPGKGVCPGCSSWCSSCSMQLAERGWSNKACIYIERGEILAFIR